MKIVKNVKVLKRALIVGIIADAIFTGAYSVLFNLSLLTAIGMFGLSWIIASGVAISVIHMVEHYYHQI